MVKIKLFASFREIVGTGDLDWNVPVEGTTAGQILDELLKEYPALANPSKAARIMLNRQYANRDSAVNSGDELAFIPPVGGG
jgi:molybdopterin converting factor subunit 1